MKLICSIALALAILIQPTRADLYYAGVGAISCAKIAQDYQQNPTEIGKVMMTWAQGFMSGANIEELQNGRYPRFASDDD